MDPQQFRRPSACPSRHLVSGTLLSFILSVSFRCTSETLLSRICMVSEPLRACRLPGDAAFDFADRTKTSYLRSSKLSVNGRDLAPNVRTRVQPVSSEDSSSSGTTTIIGVMFDLKSRERKLEIYEAVPTSRNTPYYVLSTRSQPSWRGAGFSRLLWFIPWQSCPRRVRKGLAHHCPGRTLSRHAHLLRPLARIGE
jgi:hypothetical protein